MKIIELLTEYDFLMNAVAAAILTSIVCGIVGTYIVTKRIVFISGGITHASFGGIGIGYYMGINPVLGALVFGSLSALGIEYFSRKEKIREDSMIAILWSLGMAIGIIFIFLTPGYSPNLLSYLFGNILIVSHTDIFLLLILNLVIIAVFIVFYYPILYIAFDEEYAKTRQLPVGLMKYAMSILIALTIISAIRAIGVILIISLLTIPQTTANLFSNKFRNIIFLSIIIGLIGSLGGLTISYFINIPSGATIIFVLAVIFLTARFIKLLLNQRNKIRHLRE